MPGLSAGECEAWAGTRWPPAAVAPGGAAHQGVKGSAHRVQESAYEMRAVRSSLWKVGGAIELLLLSEPLLSGKLTCVEFPVHL